MKNLCYTVSIRATRGLFPKEHNMQPKDKTIDLMTFIIMLGLAGALFGSLFEWYWALALGPVLVIMGFAGIGNIEKQK